jgi:hypothetical protein
MVYDMQKIQELGDLSSFFKNGKITKLSRNQKI